jgi:hypothetical protein
MMRQHGNYNTVCSKALACVEGANAVNTGQPPRDCNKLQVQAAAVAATPVVEAYNTQHQPQILAPFSRN